MLSGVRFSLFFIGLLASFQLLAANPQVEFATSRGNFVIELYPEKAPLTVENFLKYVSIGFYDGTIFHRTIEKFLVQGGGLTERLVPKPVLDPIPNESTNGLSNDFGTVAMAHGAGSDSATSQFFVNLGDNHILNFYKHERGLEGYTVFGRVIRGLDVLLQIGQGQTAMVGRLDHVPKEPAVIQTARVLETPVVAENALQLKAPEPVEQKTPSTKKGKKRG
jgi:cyclophilin family peptidyl-prolyl cis-trans isomerase